MSDVPKRGVHTFWTFVFVIHGDCFLWNYTQHSFAPQTVCLRSHACRVGRMYCYLSQSAFSVADNSSKCETKKKIRTPPTVAHTTRFAVPRLVIEVFFAGILLDGVWHVYTTRHSQTDDGTGGGRRVPTERKGLAISKVAELTRVLSLAMYSDADHACNLPLRKRGWRC